MQVWEDERARVGRVLHTKADAVRFANAYPEQYEGEVDLIHVRLVDALPNRTAYAIAHVLMHDMQRSDEEENEGPCDMNYEIHIHSAALVPCFLRQRDMYACQAITVAHEVFECMEDVSVWDAKTWQAVGASARSYVPITTLLDGLLRGQAPRNGWTPRMGMDDWSCLFVLRRVTARHHLTWVSLHEEWCAGRLNLVETRVHMPHGMPDLLVLRARGVAIYIIMSYAQTRAERAGYVANHAGCVLKAHGETLDGERSLEAYGLDDETPLTFCLP